MLKWTEPKTTLLSAAQVSHLWYSAAYSEELWHGLLEAEDWLTSDLEANLPTALARYRSLALYSRVPRALIISGHSLAVYNCDSHTYEKQLPVTNQSIKTSAALVFLSSRKVLVCALSKAKCISLLSGDWEKWPNMLVSREYHSALYLSASVYVFGGRNTNTAERYCLRNKQWF